MIGTPGMVPPLTPATLTCNGDSVDMWGIVEITGTPAGVVGTATMTADGDAWPTLWCWLANGSVAALRIDDPAYVVGALVTEISVVAGESYVSVELALRQLKEQDQ